jgi:CDP-paratose 2-epimerase
MKILVTGGSGFVGSNLCILLKEKNPTYHIVALDNLRRRGSELNLNRLKMTGIEFVHGDIRNSEDLEEIEGVSLIIDASADPSVLSGIDSAVYPLLNSNLIGSIRLLEFAVKQNAKLIFLSTSRVYPVKTIESLNFEETETRFCWTDVQRVIGVSSKGLTEDFPMKGSRSFYGATKLASELLIEEYCEFKGLKAIVNRCGVISGPWQMGKIDQGVLLLWLSRHYFKGQLSYIGYGGTGKQTRDVLHIDDLAELIDLQIKQFDIFAGEVFNVGGSKDISFSLKELTEICQKVTGITIPVNSQLLNRAADLRIYMGDNQKITNLCSWKPTRSVETIVSDSFEWLRANEKKVKSIFE